MRIGDVMPQLDGATTWFNGSQEDIEQHMKGKPVLVHFWAVSCGICKDKMPALQDLRKKFGAQGLQTVAIHMPRYEADTDLDTVNQAMETNGISEPVAVDSLHKLKDAFQNEQGWVPVYYLFDANGKLKTRAAGEYGISVLTTALDKMFPAQAESAVAESVAA
jgi:thiol-disulfide isomerase/thioredoxin